MITEQILKQIYPQSTQSNRLKYLPYFNEYLNDYEVNTKQRMCCYLAQIGHESGQLNYCEEIYSGEKYDVGSLAVRLGNTPEDDGDGELYKGRGLIQITGRFNYQEISKTYHVDFIKNPELLSTPEWAVKSSLWFWERNDLNKISDSENFELLTRRINGGLTNIDDRKFIYERCKLIFNTSV